MKKISFDFRLRMFVDNEFLLSAGRAELLHHIEETGSLRAGANLMNMSYRHAWGQIKKMEECAGVRILTTSRGGINKGCSQLTSIGSGLLLLYRSSKKHLAHTLKTFAPVLSSALIESGFTISSQIEEKEIISDSVRSADDESEEAGIDELGIKDYRPTDEISPSVIANVSDLRTGSSVSKEQKNGLPEEAAHPRNPLLTVDAVLEKDGSILLIKRGREPFKDYWALPGGFVEWGESTEQAVVRELEEETGIKAEVEQLICVQSEPSRDPRGHTVSVVYLMKKDFKGDLGGRDDASDARWWPIASLPKLAFDHAEIVKKAIPIIQLREQ